MKLSNVLMTFALGLVMMSLISCGGKVTDVKLGTTELDSVSYSIGVVLANNFPKKVFKEFNVEAFAKGFHDARDSSTLIEAEAAGAMANAYYQKIQEAFQKEETTKIAAENKTKFAANITENDKFVAETKAKPGIQVTATGLMYEVIKEGNGAKPTAADQVKVNYRGTFVDGKEFDSSYSRNEPAVFGVGQVIPGWTEGLQLMSAGAKYKFYIPYDLGYGERGGQTIEPFKALTFEVELLEVNPAPTK